ncbi:IS5 family transposase [Leptolyngbya sp. Cla-17]|uniref:IS5 family transposase n=1 Tax=Leptolyngbya sp. Cla-17 TaxID=2803751 RepID=UPI0018D6490F|nr:IS5 family transposase [Leptolyngbya sp. Cla-17]
MTYEQLSQLKPGAFKRRCGVHLETFEQMVAILRPDLDRRGKRGGQCKLSVEDQLLVVLEYWREYRTQFHIATTWGMSESAVCRLIQKVEGLLTNSDQFRLPGKKQLYQNASTWSVVAVDVTESPIERPPKKQRGYYSGKKKRHTLKAQVVVNQATGQIICTAFGKGRVHDFRLFKLHRLPMLPEQLCLADRGYQGMAKLHPCSCTPTKKPRKGKLSKAERQHNRNLARLRVVAEHVNRKLKIFRILAERYRNRRKRFGLRFNLIAAIINCELSLSS